MGNFFSTSGFNRNNNPGRDSVNQLDILDLMGGGRAKAVDEYEKSWGDTVAGIAPAYKKATEQLTSGYENAQNTAKGGFNQARQGTQAGYAKAGDQLTSGMGTAINTAKEGYAKAQGYYDTEPMVTSRQELQRRVLGQGGYNQGTINAMKAGAQEQYGVQARDLQRSLNSMAGDSQAGGMAGENLARGMNTLGQNKANALRAVDISNAQLQEQQQTDAITALNQEAYQRAGLSAQEANAVSGLQKDLATGQAGLTAQETNLLASLAAQEGTTLADLQAKLASGQASLTTDEAKILAEMAANHANALLTINAQPRFSI